MAHLHCKRLLCYCGTCKPICKPGGYIYSNVEKSSEAGKRKTKKMWLRQTRLSLADPHTPQSAIGHKNTMKGKLEK